MSIWGTPNQRLFKVNQTTVYILLVIYYGFYTQMSPTIDQLLCWNTRTDQWQETSQIKELLATDT